MRYSRDTGEAAASVVSPRWKRDTLTHYILFSISIYNLVLNLLSIGERRAREKRGETVLEGAPNITLSTSLIYFEDNATVLCSAHQFHM